MMRPFNLPTRWAIIALLLITTVAAWQKVKAEDSGTGPRFQLSWLAVSEHHGNNDATNEKHDGLFISVILPNRAIYNLGHYKNSYGDASTVISIGAEIDCITKIIKCGGHVGYVTGYGEHLNSPFVAFATLRWDWVTLVIVPTEVTAVKFTLWEWLRV